MTTLNETGRKRVLELVGKELSLLLAKARELSEEHWLAAEEELSLSLGMKDELARMVYLRDQIVAMQRELKALETSHEWRGQTPNEDDYHGAGFLSVKSDRYGTITSSYGGAQYPRVFDRTISSKWDLEVFKILDERMQLLKVHNTLNQVAHAVEREVSLAGTYEKARESYMQFYQLLRKAGGDDMPPLLAEIVEMPMLLGPGEEPPPAVEGPAD